ncbi:MAG: hypothetical protein VB122_06075 [Erysipelotrichales bacterium]|nr:hypothetical protein [Erysipelotrichales bacterium]
MFVFCFNDCIPQNHSDETVDKCLENSLKEYHVLTQKFPKEVNGIITSTTPIHLYVNENSSLSDCMCRIADHELKRYAFSVFQKHPVESYYDIDDEAILIDNNFFIKIGNASYNAFYPFIAFKNQGVLFSLAVDSDICKNQLTIFNDEIKIADIDNLHGNKTNTDYIANLIEKSLYDKAENLDKLFMVLGINKASERFLKNFNNFPANAQLAIIRHFRDAKKRKLTTPFSADNDLIKDVTPKKEVKIRVFELRLFDPVACRVYFYETADCIYLGTVETKPNKKTQNSHINTARNIIKELVAI